MTGSKLKLYLSKTSFYMYHIHDPRRIQKSLSSDQVDLAKQIAVALVSSKLDYCNSLFHNMAEKDIARLQRFQNCLARVVTKAPRFSRTIPILKRLQHWLTVKLRIHFKICPITSQTLKKQPACISDLLVRLKCSKNLRSINPNSFVVPRKKNQDCVKSFLYIMYIWPRFMERPTCANT